MNLHSNDYSTAGINSVLYKRTKKRIISFLISTFRILIILSISYIILFPLLAMISTAFKTQTQLMDASVVWIPKSISFDNFSAAIEALDYQVTFLKTIQINILSALIQVFACALTGYGFARFAFPGKKFFLAFLILIIIVPPQMLVVPSYVQFRNFDVLGILGGLEAIFNMDLRPNLIDTGWTFYLPSILSVGVRAGLCIFIYMQFFKGLPKELEEAASIDGAGPLQTFFRIIVPSSGVAFLTVTIFSVIWHWNEYFLSIMYFSSNFTLATRVSEIYTILETTGIKSDMAVIAGVVMAACLLFILPMLIMYLVLQKYFIRSIDRVGIVG